MDSVVAFSAASLAVSSSASAAAVGSKTENYPQNSYMARTRSVGDTKRAMVNSVASGLVTLKLIAVSSVLSTPEVSSQWIVVRNPEW